MACMGRESGGLDCGIPALATACSASVILFSWAAAAALPSAMCLFQLCTQYLPPVADTACLLPPSVGAELDSLASPATRSGASSPLEQSLTGRCGQRPPSFGARRDLELRFGAVAGASGAFMPWS